MVAATAADRTFVAEMVDYLSSMAQEEKTLFDNTINAARQYAVVFKMPYKLFRSASTTFAQDFGTKMEAYLCSMSAEEKRTFDHTIATAIRGREAAIIKHDNKTTQDEEAAATVTTIAAQEGEGGLNAFWAKMGQDEKVAAAGISPPRKASSPGSPLLSSNTKLTVRTEATRP